MKAKSISGKSPATIQEALAESKKDGYHPTLALIFLTTIENATALRTMFTEEGIAIFGVSTAEKFTEAGMQPDDIVVLLLDIPKTYFTIALKDYHNGSAYAAAGQVGTIASQSFKNPGLIISSADIGMSGEDIISGLTSTAGQGVTVMGGVAGNPADFKGIVFTNDAYSNGGLLALIIDQDKIEINGLAVSGWKPAGTEKKVTKNNGSWIFTIDNEPAMTVVQKFLGNEIVTFNNLAKGLVPLDAGYPLQFQRVSGTSIMRPVLLWNTEDKSVMVGGEVKEGDTFRFSLPPDFDVIDTVVESARAIKEKDMPDADALIVFSCVGRLGSLGPLIASEIEGLATTWNTAMAGFFSLGEFGKLDDSRCEFHGTTVSWVALKEK